MTNLSLPVALEKTLLMTPLPENRIAIINVDDHYHNNVSEIRENNLTKFFGYTAPSTTSTNV